MLEKLIRQIRVSIDISEVEIGALGKYIVLNHLKKRDFLLQQGKICRNMYFVDKGCLRMYFINNKGVEQITQFALEGWWISDFQSLIQESSSVYSIQAIEASSVVSIDKQSLDVLLLEIPQLEKYFRIVMQKALAGAQLRSKLLYEMSKEEFYAHFSNSFPEFMQRVPQYMIASYLGLSPEYLSELRNKKV